MMLYQLGGSAQHRIAESMAIAVVDILEMIEVHGKKADRTIWSGFGQYPVGNTLKRSPVGQARKSVTAGFGKELRFAAEVAALLDLYGGTAPDHPMTRVLREGKDSITTAPRRRGGARARR